MGAGTLAEYDFKIQYRRGKKTSDALSCAPVLATSIVPPENRQATAKCVGIENGHKRSDNK
jgi:hypothetical protein